MKRAVILHGTDATPEWNWFQWLKTELEAAGYEVWVPLLPENEAPDREKYNDFLFGQGWDFTDNIVVGHSSGAVAVLNLLMDSRCPKINLGVMVSAWSGGIPNGYPPDTHKFAKLFPRHGFKFRRIRANAANLAFLHGSDDPYCPVEQAVTLATKLKAPIQLVPTGGHLGMQFTELPQVWRIIAPYL
ncbi:MAG TPA: alpha/beta fold hydrolase [Candidatus Saccharimonadales bacterium]|nr:alpha/beta fold hydrolase [Candidatus Saccharimonadales bacterium]